MESVECPEDRNYRVISFAEYGDLTLIPLTIDTYSLMGDPDPENNIYNTCHQFTQNQTIAADPMIISATT